MKLPVWFHLSLVVLVLIAAPAFGETPEEGQCPVQEIAESEALDEVLFLDDGSGTSQCDEVSGCGFEPRRILGDPDAFCAATCPPSRCEPYYESGYYDEESGCCICVAI